MRIGAALEHDHRHLHAAPRHGESCRCRSCDYDGTVDDVLRLRNAVDRISAGGAASESEKLELLRDEYDNFQYHRSGAVDVYA